MAGGGIVTAAVVYAITASVGWAVLGLLISSVALNAVGQVIVHPMKAMSGTWANKTPSSPSDRE